MAEASLKRQTTSQPSLSDAVLAETVTEKPVQKSKRPAQKPAASSSASLEQKSAQSSSAERFSARQEKFQNELISVLSSISKNQTEQDKRLKHIESKLAEFEDQGESEQYHDNEIDYDNSQCPISIDNNSSEDYAYGQSKSDPTNPDIFEGIFKKYIQVDAVDSPVNSCLATLVNKVFREGISDEKFQKLLKESLRPDNCDSLVKTRVNNLVWNLLSPHVHTIDSNMQKIQEAVIKSAILITKLLSNNAAQLDESQIESGTDALGLLGQANKLINVRRKDLHKSNLNPEYHYLCSPSQKYTDMLYGDDISKNVKEIQDINKIGCRIKGSMQSCQRGSGRGGRPGFRGVYRGRVMKPRGRGRGSFSSKPKNLFVEHSKK